MLGTNFARAANINENTSASIKFIIGPAADTIASAALVEILPLKFLGFISTGLPQPIWANISIIIPIGSKCDNGFKLNLPCIFGVSSPSFTAAKACANSWNVIAIKTPGKLSNKPNKLTPLVIILLITIINNIIYK